MCDHVQPPNGKSAEPVSQDTPITILIAEDDKISSRLLEARLTNWGYQVVLTEDGGEAWKILQQDDAPQLAILDWMMPDMDGPEVCKKIREREDGPFVYVILLTAKTRKDDITVGLDAGADDYVTKPFDPKELRARLEVGVRMVGLQNTLADHIQQLEDALSKVNQLQGLLPICAYCKKIRDDKNYWQQVEKYITIHSGVTFSHGICPDCYTKYVKEQLDGLEFENL